MEVTDYMEHKRPLVKVGGPRNGKMICLLSPAHRLYLTPSGRSDIKQYCNKCPNRPFCPNFKEE